MTTAHGLPSVRVAAFALLAFANLTLAILVFVAPPTVADIITPLTGHIIGVGAAAALALLVPRHGWLVMFGAIAATFALHVWLGIGTALVAGNAQAALPVALTAGKAPSRDLSLLSINTWDRTDNFTQLHDYLVSVPADVVILSEFGPPKRALLASLRSVYPHQLECAGNWDCSLALLSRVPFEAGGTVHVTKDMPAFVWARFAGSMTVVGTHIYRPSRRPQLHARQTDAMAKFIRRIEGSVVLAGDLNMSPWSYSYRALKAQAGLKASTWLTPTWPAWPLKVPQIALDHILVSQDLAFVASRTGPAVGSDHLPVLAQIRRQPGTEQRTRGPSRNGGSRLAAAGPHLDGQFLADLGGEHGGAGNLRR